MAKNASHRWRGFGEQARRKPKRKTTGLPPPRRIGDGPMTGPQKTYLRNLCRRHGVRFNERLTKREASREIERLVKKG
jgi:hypothetical protein